LEKKKTTTVEIENLKIKIPLLFKEYLEFVYGQDWIKPKRTTFGLKIIKHFN